jgi:predicted dehydrogenase
MAVEHPAVGLVGCGGMGHRHLRAYGALHNVGVDTFELAAVCDPRIEAAEDAADLVEQLLGKRPAVFSSSDELIASGAVQAIDLVTEPSIHHLIAVPALAAGIHVLSEKPLGVTVRACREMVSAAESSGAILATAENYRRDGPNRLARAVIDSGMLGDLHLMVESNIGGSDAVLITPWRHLREKGSIALDMGVHYTDIFAYFLGDLARVSGRSFIAEPGRVLAPGTPAGGTLEEISPGVMRATGDDSLVALYEAASGVLIQLTYLPSGPGHNFIQRTLHGRNGSMSVPFDRTGKPVVVEIGDRKLSGAELRAELGDFRLTGVTAALFGAEGTEYEKPFSEIDAATIAIELDDFINALAEGRQPEVDGIGGLNAVAAVWAVAESALTGGFVSIDAVADGKLSAAQDPVDAAIGLGKPS